jgi:hypothetical protein
MAKENQQDTFPLTRTASYLSPAKCFFLNDELAMIVCNVISNFVVHVREESITYYRVNMEYKRSLYVQASTLRGRGRTSDVFYVLIGDELFSIMDNKVGDHITDYHSELIIQEEALRRTDAGRGGYMIHISQTAKLDCYATCQRGECKANKANSITNAFDSITNQMAITNLRWYGVQQLQELLV